VGVNLNGAMVIVDSCRFGEWEETIMKQWYESLFENYAQKYDKECFVQGTLGECDFIEQELNYDKNTRIIDVGCGTGRHSIELSKRA
jgi:ubiquinone/menaquinone biosynthesis C-methylase UbiE